MIFVQFQVQVPSKHLKPFHNAFFIFFLSERAEGEVHDERKIRKPAFYLQSVISPRSELENTGLKIEGKMPNVNITMALVDGGWLPRDQASMT